MADSVYSIAIDAAFSDDSALPQLDQLTSALSEAGKKSDAYASAVRRLNSDLATAKAASEAANAALATGNDRYSELEKAALSSAKALERAQAKGRFEPQLARAAEQARVALEAYAAELRPLEANAQRATAAQKALEAELAKINKVAGEAEQRNALVNQRFEKMGQAVQLLPGPLRSVAATALQAARANAGLTSVLGSQVAMTALVVVGLAALAVAVVAVTAAVVAGYVSFLQYSAATADAQRSAALTREAFSALDESTASAAASFDAITESTGLAQDRLIDLSKQLRAADVAASDMPRALRAAALAEAALGKGGASEFVARLKDGTLAIDDFANEARSKFGPIVARQLLSLTAQSERFSRLWAGLFSDLNLDPVLEAVSFLLSNLERGAPLAEFLRQAFGGLFSVFSDNAMSAAVAVEAFALEVAIWSTKAYLAVRDNLDLIRDAVDVVGIAFDLATGNVSSAVENMSQIAERHSDSFYAAGAALGNNAVLGLLEAFTGNPLGLLDTVRGLMQSVVGAAESTLGIQSPSTVMYGVGQDTVAGYTNAVDDGAGAAQGSMAALVTPGPAVTAAPAAAPTSGGARVDLSGAVFNLYGVKDAEQAAEKIGEALTKILRGDLESLQGAAV